MRSPSRSVLLKQIFFVVVFPLTMVGESAAPLPGTARGLTVLPSQDKLLQRKDVYSKLLLFYSIKTNLLANLKVIATPNFVQNLYYLKEVKTH